MDRFVFPTSNGVVVSSADKKVISATNCQGEKKLKSALTKNKIVFWHFPFLRGLQIFFCGLLAFFDALIMSLDLCDNSKIKKDNKYYMQKLIVLGAVVIFACLISFFVLGSFPNKLAVLIVGLFGNSFLRNLLVVLFKVLFFVIVILCLRCFANVCECFRFNRACDKLQSEQVLNKSKKKQTQNLKTKNKQKQTKKNIAKKEMFVPNFLNYLIFVFLLDVSVVTLCGASFGFWFNLAFSVALMLVCVSVGYEIAWVVENVVWLRWLRFVTGALVFVKPSRTHTETVNVAMTELGLLITQKDRELVVDENKKAFSVVYNEVRNKLISAGINDKSDADWLIATILGKNRAEIKLTPFVTDKQEQEILRAADRRAKGESLDNIFGWTEFYGIRFDVNKKVLTPRMETEILVEQVLKAQKEFKKPKILDLGTGSGAIAIALAKNCEAEITAIDVSKTALATAQNNAKKNDVKVEFLHSNLFENLKWRQRFDIIVSNPPYIKTADIEKLDKNVKDCDPHLALDGGEDGLDFYREITKKAGKRLNDGGQLFFEVGKGQASAVRKIMKDCGFEDVKTIKDYNKIERVVYGRFK